MARKRIKGDAPLSRRLHEKRTEHGGAKQVQENRKTWTGWACVYANCGNVQLALYTSKREALRDGFEPGDYLVRVKVEAIRGR